MNTNNTVRQEAIEWWNQQSDEYKGMQFRQYQKENFTPATDYGLLTGREVERIYYNVKLSERAISEHPQSKDTVPEMEWDLYPGNEAGAFDHLDNEQFNEDMVIKALEEDTAPVQQFKKGQRVYLKEDNNVTQIVDNPDKNWGEWTSVPVQVEGFTGGEWRVKTNKRGDIVIWDIDGNCIADCNMTANLKTTEKEANALLIANAKNLYENLKRIIDRIEESDLQNYFPSAYTRAKAILNRIDNK